MQRDDQKYDLFETAKRMVKINQDITVDCCIGNDTAVLAVSDEDEKKELGNVVVRR